MFSVSSIQKGATVPPPAIWKMVIQVDDPQSYKEITVADTSSLDYSLSFTNIPNDPRDGPYNPFHFDDLGIIVWTSPPSPIFPPPYKSFHVTKRGVYELSLEISIIDPDIIAPTIDNFLTCQVMRTQDNLFSGAPLVYCGAAPISTSTTPFAGAVASVAILNSNTQTLLEPDVEYNVKFYTSAKTVQVQIVSNFCIRLIKLVDPYTGPGPGP